MKKILSVVLVLAMVLALGVTAFAAEINAGVTNIEVGKTVSVKLENENTKDYTITIADQNGFLTIGNVVIDAGKKTDGFIAFEITAPEGTAGKLGNIVITYTPTKEAVEADKDMKVAYKNFPLYVDGPKVEDPKKPDLVKELVGGVNFFEETTTASVIMNGKVGITAEIYNTLKNKNLETITFQDTNYVWTLTRGDYTKMNVSADIVFGVTVDTKLWTLDAKKNVVEDKETENAVLKALGSTQAEVFYVTVNDACNIANVATKPSLVINVPGSWINYSNKFSVNCYKFDGENVKEIVKGLAVKPATGKLALNLTAGGTYVFVADNYTVNPTPSTSTEKPNASTGANSAAAVVALAVMAVAAVASKKIVK